MAKLTRKHKTFDCDLNDIESSAVGDSRHQPATPTSNNTNPNPANFSQQNEPPTNYANTSAVISPQPLVRPSPAPDPNNQFYRHHHQNYPQTSSQTSNNNFDGLPNSQQNNCLSKLTLSSSLHQLADFKYHTNHHHHHHHHMQTNAQQQPNDNMNHNDREHQPPPLTSNADPGVIQRQSSPSDFSPPANQRRRTDSSTKPPNTNADKNNNIQRQRNQREANLDTVHVVVGNEACDLDSAVSCLLMFHIISKMSDEINGKDKTRTLYIPLLNTTRDSLDSKCEVLWFLQKTLNIDKSFLTCKDDIDWNEIRKNGVEILVTLVDHNYNEEFKDIGKIVEIIDHHQVQNPEWLMENQANIRLTLDTSVGSCTTLVAERLFYIYAEHHVSDEILLLIYGTVLLDTICLSEKAKRFTRRDVYLLMKLDSLLGSKRPARVELYKQLVEVKNSTHELNFEKLMKRDLKIYKDKHGMRIGIASLFGMAAKEALGLAASVDLDLFFRQNQYEAFVIMGLVADVDHSDSLSRDLVLISANRHLFDELCRVFEADTSKLDLMPIGSDSSPDPEDNIINNKRIVDSSVTASCVSRQMSADEEEESDRSERLPFYKARIWSQRNVSSSRKVVAPLVLKVLHDGVHPR